MKKFIIAVIICTVMVFCCAFVTHAAGSGYVDGSTVVYNFTDMPANDPKSFTIYLFTNNAKIKCYGSASTKSPQAVNGTAVNKYNMTASISKGTVVSKGSLKTTQPGGAVVKAAEKVSFRYTYTDGKFSATVLIENPSSSLTGLAFVGKDGKSHYYALGGGTIDISALVRQAAKNAAGPGGGSSGGSSGSGSGSSGSGSGGSSGGSSGSGSGSSSGGSSGGSSSSGSGSGGSSSGGSSGGSSSSGSGSGGSSSGDSSGGSSSSGSGGSGSSSGSGSGSSGSGSGSSGSSSGSGSGSSGNGSGSGVTDPTDSTGGTDPNIIEDDTEEDDFEEEDHTQDMEEIKNNISDITSDVTSSDQNKNTKTDKKPPCVLRRIWG